jgi:GDSL-like Lipase/Acylhydrolase family
MLLSAVVAALHLATMAYAAAETRGAAKKQTHRELREAMFALTKLSTTKVVMLGDSLTEAPPWSEITGCFFVVNRGIVGDSSAGVAKRLDEIIKLKPAAVFLMIGVNDVASDIATETIVKHVRETIRKLTRAGARVYLTLVLPVSAGYAQKLNPRINELNAAYAELARQSKISLIDFRDQVRAEDGSLREELTTDGIHLTPEAYRVWRDAVMPSVLKHCPAPPAPSADAAGKVERQ